MCPPGSASRAGINAWVTRSTPITLTSYIHCQSTGLARSTGSTPIAPPALLTSTLTSGRSAANASTDAWSVTSSCTGRMPGTSAASCSSRSRRRAAATTV